PAEQPQPVVTKLSDGGTSTKYPDNSVVVMDNSNPPRMSSVTDVDGRTTSFKYDSKGQLSSLTNSEGTWIPQKDSSGNIIPAKDANGNDVPGSAVWQNAKGDQFKGSISVDNTSHTFTYSDASTKTNTTWSADGTHQSTYKDGMRTTFDSQGNINQITDANGKTFSGSAITSDGKG